MRSGRVSVLDTGWVGEYKYAPHSRNDTINTHSSGPAALQGMNRYKAIKSGVDR